MGKINYWNFKPGAMEKRKSNKYNSYKAVCGVLKENRSLYSTIDLISQTVGEFNAKLDEINKVITRTELDTTGETAAKKLAKEKLARFASELAASASVYAVETANIELESALQYSYTDLRFTSDSEALHIAMVIEAELLPHREHLERYLITEEILEELHSQIEAYDKAMVRKGGAKSEQVADFKRQTVLFKEADHILAKKLDRLMLRLRSQHPAFYDAYLNARMIVDL